MQTPEEEDVIQEKLPSISDLLGSILHVPVKLQTRVQQEVPVFAEQENIIFFERIFADSDKALHILNSAVNSAVLNLSRSRGVVTPELRETLSTHHSIVKYYNAVHDRFVEELNSLRDSKDLADKRRGDNLHRIDAILRAYEKFYIIIDTIVNDVNEEMSTLGDLGVSFMQ